MSISERKGGTRRKFGGYGSQWALSTTSPPKCTEHQCWLRPFGADNAVMVNEAECEDRQIEQRNLISEMSELNIRSLKS
jgi:hypothetical protein